VKAKEAVMEVVCVRDTPIFIDVMALQIQFLLVNVAAKNIHLITALSVNFVNHATP